MLCISYKSHICYLLLFLFPLFTFSQDSISNKTFELLTNEDLGVKKENLLYVLDHYLYTTKNNDSVSKYLNTFPQLRTDSLFYAKILYRKALFNNRNSNYDVSISSAKKSARLFKKYDVYYTMAKANLLLGNTYQALYKNSQALNNYDLASDYLKEKDRISLYTGYAAVYNQLNDLDKSISFYDKAYQTSIKLDNDKNLFNIYNGMAGVYFKNNDSEKSIEFLRKALDIAITKGDKLKQVMCLHNLGHKYQSDNDCDTALSYFEQAIRLVDKINNKLFKGLIYYKYADCLLLNNNVEKAEAYAEKSEFILTQLNNYGRLPYALRTKANIESNKGNYSTAINTLNKAISLASKNEISSITSDLYFKLAENYSNSNNAKQTFLAYENHTRIKDSLETIKKTSEIEKVKSKFEASILENKLKQDLELLSAKNATSYYRNILLFLLVLGLLYFIHKQRKIYKVKQQILEEEKELIASNEMLLKDKVKHKNSQINEYAILIDERNKFLDNIKEQISDIRHLSSDISQKKKINQLQFFIKENVRVKKEKVDLDKQDLNNEDNFRFNLEQKLLLVDCYF